MLVNTFQIKLTVEILLKVYNDRLCNNVFLEKAKRKKNCKVFIAIGNLKYPVKKNRKTQTF